MGLARISKARMIERMNRRVTISSTPIMISSPNPHVLPAAVAALVFVGCGGRGGIELSGKATLDGKPLEYASISFSPEDGQGQPVGGSIEEGEFTVTGVSPGKNRVKVTLAAEGESKPTHQRQRMQEIKDERKQ